MDTLYLICAAVGGAILIVQTLLMVFGLGGDDADAGHDVGHDVGAHADMDHADASDSFFKVLSFKTFVSFLAFFGLAGLAGQNAGMTVAPTLMMATAAGSVALFIVAWLMAGLAKLQSQGNLDLRNAIGIEGHVYLRVPAERAGPGKVTLLLQGRKIECKAMTAGPEIPTGAQVRVVATPSQDTVEVQIVE